MENLIIKNLLEQVEKLTEENKKLIEENNSLKNNGAITNNITNNTPNTSNEIIIVKNHYSSIEELANEKYKDSMSIEDFEVYIRDKVVESDLINCIYKSQQTVIIDILTRELSNKDIRPLHKNKYYVVKSGDEWIKKEYYDFQKIIKRLNNIVSFCLTSTYGKIKKSSEYYNGGSASHSYKGHRFDADELCSKLMDEINHPAISKPIGNLLHINL